MKKNQFLKSFINKLKNNPYVPSKWVKLVAERTGKSPHTIKKYAAAERNIPEGQILVISELKKIIKENREQIEELAESNTESNY
jgi:hypothetical protein